MTKYQRPEVQSIPLDTALMILLSIDAKRSMIEIGEIVGKSIGMVQRYFRYLENAGYIETPYGKTGKKSKNRGRSLTEAAKTFLRSYGHQL